MNGKEKNDILFDSLINSAAAHVFINEMNELPSIEDLDRNCPPAAELDKKIEKIITKAYRQKKRNDLRSTLMKITVGIAIVFISLTVVIFTVEATRNLVFDVIIEWRNDHTIIEFDEDSELNYYIYKPSYLPDGFTEQSAHELVSGFQITYSNKNQDLIIFFQYPAETGITAVDNESTELIEIQISGETAYLFEDITGNEVSVLIMENDGIVFELTAALSRDEIILIIESIQ